VYRRVHARTDSPKPRHGCSQKWAAESTTSTARRMANPAAGRWLKKVVAAVRASCGTRRASSAGGCRQEERQRQAARTPYHKEPRRMEAHCS